MDLQKTESSVKHVRSTVDTLKPLRATESVRILGNVKAGISLSSVRRAINKSISLEIDEAIKEGNNKEELWQYSVDSNPESAPISIPSFKFVSKQISDQSQSKDGYSLPMEEPTSLVEEGKSENVDLVTFLGGVKKLSSVINIASKFVDDVISEAFKAVDKSKQYESDTGPNVTLKDLCLKSGEAQRDRPSLFNLAINFVDNVLNESMRRTTNLKVLGMDRFQMYHSLDDFKVKDGLEIIAKCMSKWSFNQNWFRRTLYHGRMLSEESHSYFYTVWYRVETDRSQHCAFNSKFVEKWLKTVVQRKLEAFKKFKF